MAYYGKLSIPMKKKPTDPGPSNGGDDEYELKLADQIFKQFIGQGRGVNTESQYKVQVSWCFMMYIYIY